MEYPALRPDIPFSSSSQRMKYLLFLTLCVLPSLVQAQRADTVVAVTREAQEVRIAGRRSAAAGIATRSALERIPTLLGEKDVMKYLATLPGVATTSALDAGIYVRGGASDETACFVNGSPVASPEHLTGILSTFDSFVLGRSVLYKSGFPARYNGSLAAYADLQPMLEPDTLCRGEANLGLLSSSLRMRLTGRGGTVLALSARLSYLQYLTRLYNRFDEQSDIPDYSFGDVTAALSVPLGPKWTFDAFGLYSADRLRIDRGAFPLRWQTYSGNVRFSRRTDESRLSLRVAFRGRQSEGDAEQQVTTDFDNMERFLTAGIEYGHRLGTGSWELSVGGDYEYAALGTRFNSRNESADYLLGSGWIAVQGRITGDLYAEGGVNVQHYVGDSRHTLLSPRLRLRFAPGRWNIRADYARTTQYTAVLSVMNSRSPLDILRPLEAGMSPAVCDQLSVGADVEAGEAWYFYAALFFRKMHHAKDFGSRTLSAETQLEGLLVEGHGAARGAEFDLMYDRGPWHFRANYTLSDSWRQFDAINEGRRFRPPFDIRHNIKTNFSWKPTERWTLALMWSYQSGTYTTFPVGVAVAHDIHNPQNDPVFVPVYRERYNFRMPATHRLDVDVAYTRPWQRLSLTVHAGIYNAYNRSNASYVQFRAVSRDTYYTRFVPRARVLLPIIPYLSLSLTW